MKHALFLLAFAVTAGAQPIVGPEVVSTPLALNNYTASLAAPTVAMAQDKRGVAIAWSMQNADHRNRVYVARLDAGGELSGAVHEIAPAAPGVVDAMYPSLAASPAGSGFTVAWMEFPQSSPIIATGAVCRLDAELRPSPSMGLARSIMTITSAPVVRAGRSTWITMGGDVWQLKDDGYPLGPVPAGFVASDMAVSSSDVPLFAGSRTASKTDYTCKADVGCVVGGGPFKGYCYESCRIYTTVSTYTLDVASLSAATASVTYSFASEAQPAVRSDGDGAMVVWFSGPPDTGGNVVAATVQQGSDFPAAALRPVVLGTFGRGGGLTRPDIATDGQHWLVVWHTVLDDRARDVVGAAIDGSGAITPLSIAASSADEHDPSVIALGGGVFLVAYEKFANGERRIAGRFVAFRTRGRAVR